MPLSLIDDMQQKKGTLLFSIDLEDVRDQVPNGQRFRSAVPANTERYLKFLQEEHASGTFFVVGNVARKYPSLLKEISDEGHELACHSDRHVQLDRQSESEFVADLERNLEAMHSAGARDVIGYRAPTFSLTEQTRWAYRHLARYGFKYSSSVLPAANPLYGWQDFGARPRYVDGIFEIPITLHASPLPRVPVAGGVYLRVIPYPFIRYSVKRRVTEGYPVTTYLHPYDIDTQQERFMHPDLDDRRHLNYLMYINRSRVLGKLASLFKACSAMTYREYYRQHAATVEE